MRRRCLAVLVSISMMLSLFMSSCGPEASWGTFAFIMELSSIVAQHGHVRSPIVDRQLPGIILLIRFLMTWEGYDVNLDRTAARTMKTSDSASARAEAQARGTTPHPDLHATGDPYYDHVLDGVWYGRSFMHCPVASGQLPFIAVFNASPEGGGYAAIVFLDINDSIGRGRNEWKAFYSGHLVNTKGSPYFRFDDVMSRALTTVVPNVKKLSMSYKLTATANDLMYGEGSANHPVTGSEAIGSNERYYRATAPGGHLGMWQAGFTDRLYAGEFIEPPVHHPLILHFFPPDSTSGAFLYVMYWFQYQITTTVAGSQVTIQYNTANGPVSGQFDLVGGNRLAGSIWDHLSQTNKQLTLQPAATVGLPVSVKRLKPKTAALNGVGRSLNAKVTGANFVPGAMVFFDNSALSLTKVQYLNSRQLSFTAVTKKAIKPGTKIGVKVVNPDNRSGSKAAALTAK